MKPPPWKLTNRQVEYKRLSESKEKRLLHYNFTSLRQQPNNESLIISIFFQLVIIITFFVLILKT